MTKEKLREAGYVFVGPSKHSAVKVCLWTKKALTGKGWCYKHEFYGIQSHRCLQFTPAQPYCNLACRFCWRDTSIHAPKWEGKADEPKQILDEAIQAQRHLLNGFPGHPDVVMERWQEAQEPNQAAISLDGEPTLYPKLGELITECGGRGMTTFLVTNGTNPKALQALEAENALPTQLYISLSSFDDASFKNVQQPLQEGLWKKYLDSLALMNSFPTRTVLRMTLARNLNLSNAAEYAELVDKAKPDYVEVKAYMAIGKSRQRLGMPFMPLHSEIKAFADCLAEEAGYLATAEHAQSRVVLLCRDRQAEEKRIIKLKQAKLSLEKKV